ncbi:unnamed protein product [Ostreobium quekettii]|uniref:Uncharacterized protein n=1 Tax=Ostreobium quekettii TaxID=121088 RepID=A0A8S1J0L8_9CHLO|nr:unnamed protein product [Ostreobium quekettii]
MAMMIVTRGKILEVVVLAALVAIGTAAPAMWPGSRDGFECPPPGFDSVKGLDLRKYVSAPWYVQEQMPVAYQSVEDLYCVRARYVLQDEDDLTKGITVYNYANKGEVNGPAEGTSGTGGSSFQLQAVVPDLNDASKLLVGPSFLEKLLGEELAERFYGDYWVVAVGPSSNETLGYDWAIISGGPPRTRGMDGCMTGSKFLDRFQINGAGFWLFSRKPVDPESTEAMRKVAKEKGFDLSVLRKVEQEGCKYEGAL